MHWDSISDLATLGTWADPGSYAYADDQHEIDPEVARRVCGLWLEALGRTRSRKSEHAFSQPRLAMARHPPAYVGTGEKKNGSPCTRCTTLCSQVSKGRLTPHNRLIHQPVDHDNHATKTPNPKKP